MKQIIKKTFLVAVGFGMMTPLALLGQKEKEKEEKVKSGGEQIIITRTDDTNEKVVIELDGDKVKVNGKAVDGDDGDVKVQRNKVKDFWAFRGDGSTGAWAENFGRLDVDDNRAMLGVSTEKDEKGAEIQSVSKESAAERAGLKKGDIITAIGDHKVEGPDDLSAAVQRHKPGEKVSVSYIRDGKTLKTTAELGKWKGVRQPFTMSMPKMNFNFDQLPRVESIPRVQGQNWSWSGGGPKLGLFVQDSEDGKGVQVIEVDEDGNASKAGIKENDIITEIDGKAVNGADEAAKIIRESKDKILVKVKLQRQGKAQEVDVKIPRKLKTADL
jgi:serine protease Do